MPVKILLILLLSLIGADRINFLGPASDFRITPFLALSPIAILMLMFHTAEVPSRRAKSEEMILLYSVALLFIVFISVLFSNDFLLSLKRYILFSWLILSSLIITKKLLNFKDVEKLIVVAAICGTFFYSIFSFLELSNFINGRLDENILFGAIDLNPTIYGGFALRLTGYSDDPNRGAFILSFFLFFLLFKKYDIPKVILNITVFINILNIILTFSRTGYVCLIIILFFYFKRKLSFKSIVVFSTFFMVIVAGFMYLGDTVQIENFDLSKMLEDRFSNESVSSQIHFDLFDRGFSLLGDMKIFTLGVGYGSSYTVTKDILGDTKYANFHSLYLTFFVESGILSFLLLLILMFYSLKYSGEYSPIILMSLWFNIYYQTNAEPLFWFMTYFTIFFGITYANSKRGATNNS